MIEIKILGPGCQKCKVAESQVKRAVADLNRNDISIIKVERLEEIMKYNILSTPALVVNGVLKTVGRVPSMEDIKRFINEVS
ncbi:MAG: thioredoxin family protein [Candidatus Izemoplasmatales bacterium]|nr:thioredoxin family protein [bacterium]MDZ4196285.1 thioredoxin family protein [Candidatus Izemoplasmatales bacterium]